MSAKCAKASLHCDTDSDDDAAHDHDSSLSLSDAEPCYSSCDLSASNLQFISTVDDSDADYIDDLIMIASDVL